MRRQNQEEQEKELHSWQKFLVHIPDDVTSVTAWPGFNYLSTSGTEVNLILESNTTTMIWFGFSETRPSQPTYTATDYWLCVTSSGRLRVTEVFGTAGCLTIWCINYTLTISIRIPTVCHRETTFPEPVCLQKLEREFSASCSWLASLFNSCHVTALKGFIAWTNKAFQRWRSCKKVSQQLSSSSTCSGL